MVWLLASLAVAQPVVTNDERSQAELTRLIDDLERLSERQAWTGVERRYEQILALEGVIPPAYVHIQAAYSARVTGDIGAALDRLVRAQALEPTDQLDLWITAINEAYGRVELVVDPPRTTYLEADAMPFDPEQRRAIETAVLYMDQEGYFEGMLPGGTYTLSGKQFEVIPGVAVRVDLSRKELRAEKRQARKQAR